MERLCRDFFVLFVLTTGNPCAILFEIEQFEFKQFDFKQKGMGGMQGQSKKMQQAKERRQIGLALRLLQQQFRHAFEENARAMNIDDVTIAHGRILGFLAHNAERDIFQRDIEDAFRINRSSVTSVMQIMEKNGLIERVSVPQDSRLKKVCLTPLGMEMHRRAVALIDKSEAQICAGLTEQELDTFFEIAGKIEKNLETGEKLSC